MEVPLRSLSVIFSLRGSSTISMPNFLRSWVCAASKTCLKGALCFPKTIMKYDQHQVLQSAKTMTTLTFIPDTISFYR
jgi:hypothetical protein